MSTTPSERWNLLIITSDQHRTDCLGCHGNPVVQTPSVNRLAAGGLRCDRHFVHAPLCVPSRVSMHTGRYPHVHGVHSNEDALPESEQTLARTLGSAGYQTACVGAMPFAPQPCTGGFCEVLASDPEHRKFLSDHGFNFPSAGGAFQAQPVPWTDDLDESTFYANHACGFLKSKHERPFYLHVNFFRPHHPFNPPAPFDRMYLGTRFPASHTLAGEMSGKPPEQTAALENTAGFDLRKMRPADLDLIKAYYYGMISLNDKCIGMILDELERQGLADRTVVVFNSDHGEMLGDHGLLFKGLYMYDEVVSAPLILRAPGKIPSGTVISSLVEQVDTMPTLLDLLQIPVPEGVQGRSFLPLISNPKGGHKEAVFAEFPSIKMARTPEWKLVHYPGACHGELYHLTEDPHELTNLYKDPQHANALSMMQKLLVDWTNNNEDPKLTRH